MKLNLRDSALVRKLYAFLRDPLYVNSFYLLINYVINALVGLAFWVIVARFFTVSEVGLATSTISGILVLALFSRFGLDTSIIRFLPNAKDKNEAKALINLFYTFSVVIALVASIIFLVGLNFWSPALVFLRDNKLYAVAFIILTIIYTLATMIDGVFIASRRSGFVLAKNIIYSVLRLVLPILLMGVLGTAAIVGAWGIAVAIASAVGLFIFLPKVHTGYRPSFYLSASTARNLVSFSLANYVAELAMSAPGFLLPILVVNILGAESAAYFFIAWSISGLIMGIPNATATVLFAEGSYEDSKLGENVIRTFKFTFIILIPAIVVALLLANKVLSVFYGAEYAQNSINLLQLLVLSNIPLAFTHNFISVLRVEKRLAALVAVTAFVVIVSLGMAYFLLPHLGLIGAGVGWTVANCVITVITVVYLRQSRRIFRK